MKMYKQRNMEKKILTLVGILVLALTLIVSVTVLATNEATQGATTNKATTIAIKNQTGATDVSTITFPAAEPSAEVVAPYNEDDGSGSAQLFSGSASKPVVQLVSATTYNLWWTVTDLDTWDTTVSNENCYITNTADTVTKAIFDAGKATRTTWGAEANTTQQVTSAKKYFYLTVTLEAVGEKQELQRFPFWEKRRKTALSSCL